MRFIFLLPCLVLCSCFSKDEAEPTCIQIGDSCYPILIDSSEPCSLPSYEPYEDPDPSILNYCPAEDVAEYPITDTLPYNWCNASYPVGVCLLKLKLSKEELLFGAQGGVKCIATDRDFGLFGAYDSGGYYMLRCAYEEEVKEVSGYYDKYFKKLTCPEENPWLAATKVDVRVFRISVDKNETGSERKLYIHTSCQATLSITQSAE